MFIFRYPGWRLVLFAEVTVSAIEAIKAARKDGEILVAAFDGIPAFVDLLKSKAIVASGMQQPYLMGQKSGEARPIDFRS